MQVEMFAERPVNTSVREKAYEHRRGELDKCTSNGVPPTGWRPRP
jgi:hypothetical protein